ncbi:MAG: hypothetical protein Q7U33_01220 [Methylotenera sp.]|uniref:hypothetical protein n=1 Tax=Methylotenera sp. TaxID=2051956 RepID=UPI0027193076|nr:hypothetical protein [Methylotenera sp.]MDO9149980.1 hypothetical protein [Methylotenera sp.]
MVAAIMAATLQAGRHMADSLSSYEKNIRLNLAVESAVYDVIFELLEQGERSRWIRENGKVQTLLIDNQAVEVISSNVHGMIDVNTADERLLQMLSANLPRIYRVNALTIQAKRDGARYASYSDLSASLNIPLAVFSCVYPYVTLFSGRTEPSAALISEQLKKMIGRIEDEKHSAMEGNTISVAGEVFRINAAARTTQSRTNYLSAEVLLTGRRDFPYLIRSWSWIERCQIAQ